MPSPRQYRDNREPVRTAVTVEYDRPYGHREVVAVTPRNGLPVTAPYRYRGIGHDLTGDCMCGDGACQWSGRQGNNPRAPRLATLTDDELLARINGPSGGRKDRASRELRRRQAGRRAALAAAS